MSGTGPQADWSAGGDIRPRPDPTLLTTQALNQQIAALQALIEATIHGDRKANDLRVENVERLCHDQFASIQTQFQERDLNEERARRDSKASVTAALDAAKEAVSRSELNTNNQIAQQSQLFNKQLEQLAQLLYKQIDQQGQLLTKQIDQQALLLQTTTGGLLGNLSDIKERVLLIEGRGSGFAASWGIFLGAVGLVSAVLAIGLVLINLLGR